MEVVEKLYFLEGAEPEYWRNLCHYLLSENNMSFRKYTIQISTYCLLMHLCKFFESTKTESLHLYFWHLIQLVTHLSSYIDSKRLFHCKWKDNQIYEKGCNSTELMGLIDKNDEFFTDLLIPHGNIFCKNRFSTKN